MIYFEDKANKLHFITDKMMWQTWLFDILTHWGRVTQICVGNLTIIDPDNGLNQCCDIVNWTLRNKLEWNFNRYSYIFIQENLFENIVCEMASILSRPQCVNSCWNGWEVMYHTGDFYTTWYIDLLGLKGMTVSVLNVPVIGCTFVPMIMMIAINCALWL